MKRICLLSVVAIVLLSTISCNQKQSSVKLETFEDSVSYAIGMRLHDMYIGDAQLAKQTDSLIVVAAFNTLVNGETTLLTAEEEEAVIQSFSMKAQEEQQRQMEAQYETTKHAGEKFLAENAQRPEVKTTESGLQYEVISEGSGKKPEATSTVKVHYEGTTIDGKVFDSSYERGEPAEFPLNRVISGWTEGLQLMTVGSKYKLFVPYQLGYGERGAGADIPPYSTLIFTVELLEVK